MEFSKVQVGDKTYIVKDAESRSSITTLDSTVSEHTTEISNLSGTVASHTTSINSLNGTVASHTTSINNLNNTVDGHTNSINSLNGVVFGDSTDGDSGTSITLDNTIEGHLQLDLYGNTSQSSTPTPTSPVDVNVVSGNNTITISNDDNTESASYPINLGSYELCKIGDYKDSIFYNKDSKNLFDDSVANNKWLNGNGILANATNANTIKIYCNENETFTLSAKFETNTNESAIVIACFDENDNMLSRNAIGSNYSPVVTKTTPANTKYIYAGHYMTKPITIQLEKNSTATSYQPYEDGWYIKKNISKLLLNGSESSWALHSSNANRNVYRITISDKLPYTNNTEIPKMFSDYFIPVSNNSSWVVGNLSEGTSNNYIYYVVAPTYTLDTFKTWLSSNNVTTYYILKTSTYIKITDTSLIDQLNNLYNAKSYNEETNINQVNNDLPFNINATAFINTLDGKFESLKEKSTFYVVNENLMLF